MTAMPLCTRPHCLRRIISSSARRRCVAALLLGALALVSLTLPPPRGRLSLLGRYVTRRHLAAVAGDRKLITYRGSDEFWGIGNHMFAFASTLATMHALGGERHWTLCLDGRSPLRAVFDSVASLPHCDSDDLLEYMDAHRYFEQAYAKYDEKLHEVLPTNRHVVLDGYLQSWKYFGNVERIVRKQYIFNDRIENLAHAALADVIEQHLDCVGCYDNGDVITVGVHVRRGDMAYDEQLMMMGYVAADRQYLLRAFQYFHWKFHGEWSDFDRKQRRRHVFVVCSDDIEWCRANIPSRWRHQVAFVSTRDAAVDLAVLAQCDHTIMTVGTFGWWAAWLANGTTVYVRDWPRYGSNLYEGVSHEDYFPPYWTGL